MTHAEETKGLPSASGYERIKLCPGSWQAERGIAEDQSEDADAGDRIHRYLAGEKVDLDDEERDRADWIAAMCDRLIASTFGDEKTVIYCEHRMWMRGVALQLIFSGKADRVIVGSETALIVDFKSLWGEHARSSSNPQLRALAVMANRKWPVRVIRTAIIQPTKGEPTVCEYSQDDLRTAEAELRATLAASNQIGAPRIPGEKQCKYCRARSRCPEAISTITTIDPVAALPSLGQLSGEEIALNLERAAVAEQIIKALRAEAKARIQSDPQAVPGFALSDGTEKRKVADVYTLNTRLLGLGASQASIVSACSISIKDVNAIIRKATGSKGRDLKDSVNWALDGCVKVTRSARSLVRVGEALEDGSEDDGEK